eukprot:SAG31_NODE_871_length_11335_cov_4.910822_7_plen_88_part_00
MLSCMYGCVWPGVPACYVGSARACTRPIAHRRNRIDVLAFAQRLQLAHDRWSRGESTVQAEIGKFIFSNQTFPPVTFAAICFKNNLI